ncbi:APC family permease [Rhodococcus sp. LB1]|uniref:APC family permease n=1 Tax=Rhodococcus sp. LB1 TaxID=1807499 RepID=UPI00077AEB05|nr:APC family permease [Rhodococcus sp. LB1]KXX58981.1 amino acid transporter [Rhodococcus sp. LB1]
MSTSTSADNIDPADAAAHLEAGRLGRTALVSLSLSAFYPAVSLALVPFLVFTTAGVTAWQSSLLATLAVVCIGRAVIVFARRYVATGSLYSYIAEVFGPRARYLTGAALLGGYITVVTGAVAFVGVFVGSFLYSRGLTTALQFGPQAVIFAITLAGAAAIALRGLGTSVRIAVVLAVLALPLVVVITVASAHHTGLDLAHQFVFADFSLSHTMQGIAVGAALLIGFESCAVLATETRDPLRNVPVAVMAAPVVLGGLFPIVTILQVPGLAAASDQLAAGMSAPAALAIQSGLGTSVATATDLVLAVASFASLIGFVNYAARFAMTLAEDGLLPDVIARVHPRYHSPYAAIGALSVAGFAMVSGLVFWTGDIVSAYTPIATLIVYLWVLPYVLIAAGAIVLTVRAREFRPGLWLAAAIGAAAMAWSYLNGLINPPAPPAGSMAWVAVVTIAALVVIFTASQRWRTRQSQHEWTDRTTSTGPTR